MLVGSNRLDRANIFDRFIGSYLLSFDGLAGGWGSIVAIDVDGDVVVLANVQFPTLKPLVID